MSSVLGSMDLVLTSAAPLALLPRNVPACRAASGRGSV